MDGVDTSLDAHGFLRQYDTLYEEIYKAFDLAKETDVSAIQRVEAIAIVGMGGSAIAGGFLKAYFAHLKKTLPVYTIRDYHLPVDIPENTLYFVISHSGNTEETVSTYREIVKKTKQVIGIGTGGKIESIANMYRLPYIKVQGGHQPRTAALSSLFMPILRTLVRVGILENLDEELTKLSKEVRRKELRDLAVSISEKLVDKTPLIYASAKYYTVAYRMKTELNENAKVHAFCHEYSEMNHNELEAFETDDDRYHIVTFVYDDDHPRIKKRMEIVKEITNAKGIATTEIKLSGPYFLAKFLSGVVLGDLISANLALRYGRDPSPVELIEDFKKRLGPSV